MADWSDQDLVFNYYFPTYGSVFTGSPISFVANGSPYLSTDANLSPATFSVTGVAANEVQISYSYPLAAYPTGFTLTNSSFNGFTISGPAGDTPIVAAVVDAASTVTGFTDAKLSFTGDSVTANLAADGFTPGSAGLIDVQFAVPEPGSLALLAAGLLAALVTGGFRRT